MRNRLILSFVALTVVILVVFGVPLRGFVESVERDRLLTTLERDAFILAGHARETLGPAGSELVASLEPYIAEHSASTAAKVIVTNQSGVVVASNDPTVLIGDDYLNRPEIVTALTGQPAVGDRKSRTLGEELVFVAVPVLRGDEILGVVRFSNPQSKIDERVRESLIGIAIAGSLTVLAGIALAVPIALGIARPLVRLRRNADELARGNFETSADEVSGPREVRELAAAFNSMSRRLNAMMESQRQFNSMVSHQLRTPLTALRLRLEYIQNVGPSESEDVVEAVSASYDEVDRLQEIIDQLLNLSRLEAGVVPSVDADVAQVVSERVEMWKPLAEEKQVTLVVDVKPGLRCRMIEGGLDQVIDNYVDNALSVSDPGSTVIIRSRESGSKVLIEVVDEGPGMNDEEKEAAFVRFWRSPSNQNSPGTGLGLAIVRQIAVAGGAKAYFLDRADEKTGLVAVVECVSASN